MKLRKYKKHTWDYISALPMQISQKMEGNVVEKIWMLWQTRQKMQKTLS